MNELAWQAEYAREFERTNGFGVSFEKIGGGWWRMCHTDTGIAHHRSLRRSEVERMTVNLRVRPDFNPMDATDAEFDF